MFLTTHVTVCVCHAQLKGYLLTYLFNIIVDVTDMNRTQESCVSVQNTARSEDSLFNCLDVKV